MPELAPTTMARLQFVAITQVAGVAETGNNILMLVHARVDSRAPDSRLIVGKGFHDVLNALRSGYDAAHVDAKFSHVACR